LPSWQAYWLGFSVHLSSAAVYPIFPWIRDHLAGKLPSVHGRFTASWPGSGLTLAALLGVVAAFGAAGHEVAWLGEDPAYDQAFMRRMAAHHRQGVALAEIGVERAKDAHLQAICRLMAAAQSGEIHIFDQWWGSWFDGPLPPLQPCRACRDARHALAVLRLSS
jgi:hypothetical protein